MRTFGHLRRHPETPKTPMTPQIPNPKSLPPSEVIAAKRAKRLASCPMSCRKLFERSYAGKTSPRASIKAFCLECVGFDRAAVTTCTAYACPLWNLRPYQPKSHTRRPALPP